MKTQKTSSDPTRAKINTYYSIKLNYILEVFVSPIKKSYANKEGSNPENIFRK